MKRFLRILAGVVGFFYLILIIIVTALLLCYNDYSVTEIFNHSLIIVDDELEPYNKGDLVLVENSDEIQAGEKVFYYNTYNEQIKVKIGTITEVVEEDEGKIIYAIDDGEHKVSSEFVIGQVSTANSIQNLGTVLGILESKWGFLFLIVLPALLAFVNQIMVVASGIKEARETEKDE